MRSLEFLKNVPTLDRREIFPRGQIDTFKDYGMLYDTRAFQRTNSRCHIMSQIYILLPKCCSIRQNARDCQTVEFSIYLNIFSM